MDEAASTSPAADRKQREREFHDQRFSEGPRAATSKYYAADAGKAHYRDLVLSKAGPGVRVLEYGCGTGSLALELGRRGADVMGVDISPVAITSARRRARRAGLDISFEEMDAESLDLPDQSFDIVCGSGILHHLEFGAAADEIARVLTPDGVAVFVEPLGHNPLINLYRRATPRMRSADEEPLRHAQLRRLHESFDQVELTVFDLIALAGVPLLRWSRGASIVARLHDLDRWIFRRWARARRWAWVVVIEVSVPAPKH
jgi:SAM-dependent methyltransferase